MIKLLASMTIDMGAVDQALQTRLYKDEAALLRELDATKLLEKSPVSGRAGEADV